MKLRNERCAASGKTIFETEEEAIEVMNRIKGYNSDPLNNKRQKHDPKRVYLCEFCTGWHLTSIESWKDKKVHISPLKHEEEFKKYINNGR